MKIKTNKQIWYDYDTLYSVETKWAQVDDLLQELEEQYQALSNCDIIHIKGKAYDSSIKETSQGHYAGVQAQIQLIEQLQEKLNGDIEDGTKRNSN